MKASKTSYNNLTDAKKIELLKNLYVKSKNSFADIASIYNTYANKLRRDAKRFNIPIRNKSEAQKNALKTGKHKHPTKGTHRTEETKRKIGMGVLQSWDSLDSNELEQRKETHRKLWNDMSDEQKQLMKQSFILKKVKRDCFLWLKEGQIGVFLDNEFGGSLYQYSLIKKRKNLLEIKK